MPKIFNFTVNNVDHYDQYLDQNNDLKSRNCDQDDDFTLIMIDTVTKMMVKITQSLLMTNLILLLLLLLEKREKKKKKNTKFVLLLTTNFILHLLKFSILLFNPILLKKRKFVSLLMLNPILNVLLLTNCVLLLI